MKIAVLFAYNANNAGMYSVDLAGFRMFEAMGHAVDYFVASGERPGHLVKYGQIPIYRIDSSAALWKYDRVVYWGDFITSPQYGYGDFWVQLNRGDGPLSRTDAARIWADIFLLGQQRSRKRPPLYAFGQNFQTIHLVEGRFSFDNLAGLYGNFEVIMPRDSRSLAEFHRYFPALSPGKLRQGCDCAFLLDEDYRSFENRNGKRVGFFLGRSTISNAEAIPAALGAMQLEVVDLKSWLAVPRNDMHSSFLDLMKLIKSCDYIVTDTYHLAINAIREGTTPVVLGDLSDVQMGTLGDLKKRVLLDDLGSGDLYVPIADGSVSPEAICQAIDGIRSSIARGRPHPVHETSREMARKYRDDFVAAWLK